MLYTLRVQSKHSVITVQEETGFLSIQKEMHSIPSATPFDAQILSRIAVAISSLFWLITLPHAEELIKNGSFTDHFDHWTKHDPNDDFHANEAGHRRWRSFPGYAFLSKSDGTPGNELSGAIFQSVAIPVSVERATLSFYYSITTEEDPGAQLLDRLVAYVNDDTRVDEFQVIGNPDARGATYTRLEKDITSFRGKTVRVNFVASTNPSNPSTIRIDDVSLQIERRTVETKAFFVADLAVSPGFEVVFDARQSESASGALLYSWDFGDGEAITTSNGIVHHTYQVIPGVIDRTVTLTVTDSLSNSDSVQGLIRVSSTDLSNEQSLPSSGSTRRLSTGEFTQTETDLAIASIGIPFSFSRTYRSTLAHIDGPLGFGWQHSYQISLSEDTTGVSVTLGNGRSERFELDNGIFTPAPGIHNRLEKKSDGTYIYTTKTQVDYLFDQSGRILRLIDGRDRNLTLEFSYIGDLLHSIIDPSKRVISFEHPNGKLTSIVDHSDSANPANPRKVQFAYDAAGNLAKVTDPEGNITRYGYSPNHLLQSITEPNGNQKAFHSYSAETGALEQTIDGEGFTTDYYVYPSDLQNDTSKITNPLGEVRHHKYRAITSQGKQQIVLDFVEDPDGKVERYFFRSEDRFLEKVRNRRGHSWQFDTDTNGNITLEIDPLNNETRHKFDDENNLTLTTNPLGFQTKHEYRNRVIFETTDPVGIKTRYEYGDFNWRSLPTRIRIRSGSETHRSTSFEYDGQGNRIREIDSNNHIRKFEYDKFGRRTAEIDPRSDTFKTTFQYDRNDQVRFRFDPRDFPFEYRYDANGNLVKELFPRSGAHKTNEYDKNNRLTKENFSDLRTVEHKRDALGRERETINGRGFRILRTFDVRGYPRTITDQLGHTTTFDYDSVGNRRSQTNPLGYTTTFEYDKANRLTLTTYPDNTKIVESPDALGRTQWIEVSSPDNSAKRRTAFTYFKDDNLQSTTDPSGAVVLFAYDPLKNRNQITFGATTATFDYDGESNLKQSIDYQGRVTAFTYDAANNPETTTRPDGSVIKYQYNARNEPTQSEYPEDLFTFNYNAMGSLIEFSSTIGRTELDYDLLERPLAQRDPFGHELTFTYDAESNLETLTYPGNNKVLYTYDAADRLVRIETWYGSEITFTYDDNNNLTEQLHSNGTKTTREYDNRDRLRSLATTRMSDGSVICSYTLSRDFLGHPQDIQSTQPLPDYIPHESLTYSYSATGSLESAGDQSVRHDPNGNVEECLGWLFDYNSADRLVSAENEVMNIQCKYNALNQRLLRTKNGIERRYLVDTTRAPPRILGEYDGDNNPIAFYIYGDHLAERFDAKTGEAHTFHSDFRGNIVALTNSSGTITDRYSYSPFGQELCVGTTDTPFRFLGSFGIVSDGEGLVYLNERYYLAPLKRFLSLDPIWGVDDNPQTFNRYGYALNNPYVYTDLDGRLPVLLLPVARIALGIAADMLIEKVVNHYLETNDVEIPPAVTAIVTARELYKAGSPGGILRGIYTALRRLSWKDLKRVSSQGKQQLSDAGRVVDKGGDLTKAGRAVQKHGSRPGSIFPAPKGNPTEINAQGQRILDDILNSPEQTKIRNRHGGLDIHGPDGRGARFDKDNNFVGFLEPIQHKR